MKTPIACSLCLLTLVGCDFAKGNQPIYGDGQPGDMMTGDMVQPSKCDAPAAAGLSGDSLLCVDFSKNPQLTGWNLSVNSNCPWTMTSGTLQLTDYGAAGSDANHRDCDFMLPPMTSDVFGTYQSLTLAVVQNIDIEPPPAQITCLTSCTQAIQYHTASIKQGSEMLWSITGTTSQITTRLLVPIATVTSSYQPRFNLHAEKPSSSRAGWAIYSIAVLGNK